MIAGRSCGAEPSNPGMERKLKAFNLEAGQAPGMIQHCAVCKVNLPYNTTIFFCAKGLMLAEHKEIKLINPTESLNCH
jgi:hypothetical protein